MPLPAWSLGQQNWFYGIGVFGKSILVEENKEKKKKRMGGGEGVKLIPITK